MRRSAFRRHLGLFARFLCLQGFCLAGMEEPTLWNMEPPKRQKYHSSGSRNSFSFPAIGILWSDVMGVYKLMGVTKLMGVEEADLRCDVARRQVFYWRITVFI